MVLFLHRRPDSTRAETAFFLESAELTPVDMFPPAKAATLRAELAKPFAESFDPSVVAGSILVLLYCLDTRMANVVRLGVYHDDPNYRCLPPRDDAWESALKDHLKQGIVM